MDRRPHPHARWLLALAVGLACTKESSDQIKDALEETIKEQLRKEDGEGAVDGSRDLMAQPELLANKLGLYLECATAAQTPVRDHFVLYSEGVEDDGALRPGRERPSALPAAMIERCQKATKEGPHLQPPQPELEAAQRAFTEALEAYQAQAKELSAITASIPTKGKIDAALQDKARALHEPIVAAFERWEGAAATFVKEMDATQGRVDTATLARIEKISGKKIEYHARAFVIRSRPLVQCLGARADTRGCESAYFELEQAHGELKDYLDAHKNEAEGVFWLDRFVASADEYYAAASALLKDLRAGTVDQDGSAKVIGEFNDLLRDAANLRFRPEGQGGGAGKPAAGEGASASAGEGAAAGGAG